MSDPELPKRPFGHRAEPVAIAARAKRKNTHGGHRRVISQEDQARIALRRQKALDLAASGASYRQIAAATSVSLAQAYDDVQAELESLAALRRKKAERVVDMQLRKLDKWTLALTPAAQKGDPVAIARLLQIEERRAKLLGLDKPTKVAPTTPDGNTSYQGIDLDKLSTETLERIFKETEGQEFLPEPGPEDDLSGDDDDQ